MAEYVEIYLEKGSTVNKNDIFLSVQKALNNPPLILVGTGGTIPYGISGMPKLAKWLFRKLNSKYDGNPKWKEFDKRLKSGLDLETALTDLNMPDTIIDDIVMATWQLVSGDDLQLFETWLENDNKPTLGKIVNKFYQANPQCVNIITTNYDRLIEYSCDQYFLPINLFFEGEFIKRMRKTAKPTYASMVNILKVHGSLDWYYDKDGQVVSIPMRKEIPCGFKPAIVTPGMGKYKRVLESPFRDILHIADELIEKAGNYLCIGYGFNDSQIQTNIISGIRTGKPIVVVTMEISKSALQLIQQNSENYIVIHAVKDNHDRTEIITPQGREELNGQFWTQDGFYTIF